jgi:hypothetical protein
MLTPVKPSFCPEKLPLQVIKDQNRAVFFICTDKNNAFALPAYMKIPGSIKVYMTGFSQR